jgi:3-methyladenine DNA glycosylase AlkD
LKNKSNVLDELRSLGEDDYKAFNRRIVPTKHETLGIRVPVLRKIAKRIAKDEAVEFIRLDKQNIYEMILLEGMVLSYMDRSFKELLPQTEIFLEKVDNWAQIDTTICNFKNIKNEKEDVLKIVKRWLKSDKEFFVRAGLITLLSHFVKKEYLEMIFSLSQSVKHTGYYVHMGNAWLISVCMAKFPDETIEFFKNNTLDKKTHNKAIQKSRESFRVSKEDKALINKLKRK